MTIAGIQPLARAEGGVGVDDQVYLVGRTGGKPGPGEVKRRPREFRKPQNLAVESPRAREVCYAQTHVVDGFNSHGRMPCPSMVNAKDAVSQIRSRIPR